jgi:hypothetical protein
LFDDALLEQAVDGSPVEADLHQDVRRVLA